ncbi:MAG: metallophosphoesterase [Actinobacteria bacterium]|nr:metallophosphoesterase [Actinomycetota bacterium]
MTEVFKKGLSAWWIALALAIVASILSAVLFGYSSYDIDGFRIGIGVTPSYRGETELAIPPFGEIAAFTHKTPLRLKVVFERIYLHEIGEVADGLNDHDELIQRLEAEGKDAFQKFIFRLIILAALGGAIGAAVSPRKRFLKATAGALIGAALVGALLVGTYYSFNVYAFKQPRYSGALSAAPWATEAIAKKLGDIKAFRQEVRSIARNVGFFYSKVDSWQPIDGDTLKVLHVSDIHNNPAAVDLIRQVVIDFNVDMIIDTGDITDLGTPVETGLIEGIANLPVPYAFVAGNHDSSDTIAFLKDVKNVIILEGKPVTINGITILGVPDPASLTHDVRPVDETSASILRARLEDELKASPKKPLILAVHSPRVAEKFFGRMPIVLVGHTHKANLKERRGYILSNAGTTGAAGIRTFRVEQGVPYTLNILHIQQSPAKLVAVDSLTVKGAEREFRLERNLVEGAESTDRELEGLSAK